MIPQAARLHAALEATWPPAARLPCGPFTLRDGGGGGKRVSAATLDRPFTPEALAAAEKAMRDRGARPLFMIRSGEDSLELALADRDYAVVDPTVFYVAPVATVAEPPRPVSLFECWPPLALQKQIWRAAGIGPERLAVMARASAPRTAFIARFQNRAAGVGFCALDTDIAMLHALEIEPAYRRQGVARRMIRGMADWAQAQGGAWFALAVTERNIAARGLYSALGMTEAGGYHYRQTAEDAS
ncbi:GNAT family N-acetyltransferase [Pararhodobacter sp. SW119]|uniref:GNAT family N-acetyltransferase n=1 Tax=Pararhodobacter sp. SW119 TaxID=2780075 RepID=UPI001AE030D9|nr:GNAT family N-acetyltransferase [Pararhodobacter sp. SW119]